MSYDQCVTWFRQFVNYILYLFSNWADERWFVVSNGFLFFIGLMIPVFVSMFYVGGVDIDD